MNRQIRTDLAVESMELLKKEAPGVEKPVIPHAMKNIEVELCADL